MDATTSTIWRSPFLIERVSSWFCSLPCFVEISAFNANSVDPDQMPRSATVSDLGLHCLTMSLLWDARHKWVNMLIQLLRKANKLEVSTFYVYKMARNLEVNIILTSSSSFLVWTFLARRFP